MNTRNLLMFAGVLSLFLLSAMTDGWNYALNILNVSLLAAIMALGVNMQWGYAGLFNIGVQGFTALGGLAVVLIAAQPVPEGFAAGGPRILGALALGAAAIGLTVALYRRMAPGRARTVTVIAVMVGAFFAYRAVLDPAVTGVEAFNPATAGNIGGFGLPVLLAWPVGALLAAAAAWAIGKICLGLRSDYLAIATLGIAEIIIIVLRNEDWLARGVKMVNDLPRPWPVPMEVDLQDSAGFVGWAQGLGADPVTASSIVVKLAYLGLILVVLGAVVWLSERALNSPWGRMMRAIRDNEVAAEAMGKNVTARHLQIFVLGSAVIGFAGAMMITMDGLMNPGTFNPLRYTFLIWVMVIIGGSGNNWGSVLGALLIGWLWLVAENYAPDLMALATAAMGDGALKTHLTEAAPHMRLFAMGIILLVVLRFAPKGLIPEK
jgi:branched-chain amino acid transport system permease protein